MNAIQRRQFIEAQPQFQVAPGVHNRQDYEIHIIAVTETQVRVARRVDVERALPAANNAIALRQLGDAPVAMNDDHVQKILDARLRIERYPQFELIRNDSRKGPRVLNE